MAAAAAAAAPLVTTYNPAVRAFTSQFDAHGREYIVLRREDLPFLGHLADGQNRVFVTNGQVVNTSAENLGEILARTTMLSPAQIAAHHGVPGVRYWIFRHEGGRQVQPDSSGGTWGDVYPQEGGTGGTGSGKPDETDSSDEEGHPYKHMAMRAKRMGRGPPRFHQLDKSYFVNPALMHGGAKTIEEHVNSFIDIFEPLLNQYLKMLRDSEELKDAYLPASEIHDAKMAAPHNIKDAIAAQTEFLKTIHIMQQRLHHYDNLREKITKLLRVMPKNILDFAESRIDLTSTKPPYAKRPINFDQVKANINDDIDFTNKVDNLEKTLTAHLEKNLKTLREFEENAQRVFAKAEAKQMAKENKEMMQNDFESQLHELVDKPKEWDPYDVMFAEAAARHNPDYVSHLPSWMFRDMPELDKE
jgi:hypothetical protein